MTEASPSETVNAVKSLPISANVLSTTRQAKAQNYAWRRVLISTTNHAQQLFATCCAKISTRRPSRSPSNCTRPLIISPAKYGVGRGQVNNKRWLRRGFTWRMQRSRIFKGPDKDSPEEKVASDRGKGRYERSSGSAEKETLRRLFSPLSCFPEESRTNNGRRIFLPLLICKCAVVEAEMWYMERETLRDSLSLSPLPPPSPVGYVSPGRFIFGVVKLTPAVGPANHEARGSLGELAQIRGRILRV